MRALIAFDKFKDAISAHEACATAKSALLEAQPDWEVETAPLADGGDGFCETLTLVADGYIESFDAVGPLGEPIMAKLGLCALEAVSSAARSKLNLPADAKRLAILELASTSGIALVPPEKRSPWTTTTFGLGQAILHAAGLGADALLIGLGGSATHDLACGALQALGFRFIDISGKVIENFPSPERWRDIYEIKRAAMPFSLPVRIACDVENPLTGSNGAAAVFGPQKGLRAIDFADLDSLTQRTAIQLCHATGMGAQTLNRPGAGAAGGAAFGLMAGLDGILLPGAELVFAWVGLAEKLERADLVITGEGRFDASSLQGKGPGSLLREVAKAGKSACVFAGSLGALPEEFSFRADCHAISPAGIELSDALAATETNLFQTIWENFGPKGQTKAKPSALS